MSTEKALPKSSSFAYWLALGCGGLVFFAICTLSFTLKRAVEDMERQLATLMATDDSITAPGDGAQVFPVTPEDTLSVGQSSVVDNVRVTVTYAQEVEDTTGLHITPEGYLYWVVQFTIENISDQEIYPNPIVSPQMQYSRNGRYIWELDSSGDCVPSYENGVFALEPQARVDCSLIYTVPRDDQPLYWVYISMCGEQYVVYRVR